MLTTGVPPSRSVARLYGLGTALPPTSSPQSTVMRFMTATARASFGEEGARAEPLIERLYSSSGIERRHSVLTDYAQDDPSGFEFYPPNRTLEPFPSTARRMEAYERESPGLAEAAGRAALARSGFTAQEVTHLVFTTCTGFFAPGPDVMLIARLGLRADVARTQVGFMGCYAGFNAMKLAGAFVAADPDAVVLIVSVELCTLHFQKRLLPEFLVANSLFADGAAAAVFAAPGARPGGLADLAATHGRMAPDSLDQMSWRIGDTGFEMSLDRRVPDTIRSHAPAFVAELSARAGLARDEIRRWVPHPGGRRIVSALSETLGLDDEATRSSRGVLADCGNMSSATIFFVLEREFARGGTGPLVALGFGPGLTMEGALFLPAR
ncbi:MAG: type III polyketide synthase [Elusimicrobiota bacterium]|nr:MAG: type III polyketide synthase [Elusimicrobiota bacterium]